MNGVEINTRAYVATRLLLRWDYLYAVTLKTKVFGDYNHARLEVSWITSTRGLLLRGYTGAKNSWLGCTMLYELSKDPLPWPVVYVLLSNEECAGGVRARAKDKKDQGNPCRNVGAEHSSAGAEGKMTTHFADLCSFKEFGCII